jgi:starch synthase
MADNPTSAAAAMPIRICAIASEVAPFAKTGGLADVAAALTKYLHAQGHDVRLFVPLYSAIDRDRFPLTPVATLANLSISIGPHRYQYSVYTAALPGSTAQVHLIDCPPLYARAAIYSGAPDEHLRFLALTRIAIECCQYLGFSPQILHCHDWHAAFGPLLLRALYSWDRLFADTRTVLTIHNIGYQGEFSASAVADLALGDNAYLLHQDDLRAGRINSLKHGCMYADAITTVSPTYAVEIRTPEYGLGLEEVLRNRAAALVGILNGVDYDEWDPRTDRHIGQHYDAARLPIKAQLKRQFLARMGLAAGPATALAGVVTRLATQKGIDLMLAALPALLAHRDLVFVALGAGEPRYEAALGELAAAFPGRVAFQQGYSEELAHWIEAASDMFLMPSQYEPCGLNQMYSLRYGTVPVVRRTGGLADSVQRYDPATGQGTGIVFAPFTATALAAAIEAALDLYGQPEHWNRMVRNGMAQDFSWVRQGSHYVALFERMLQTARVTL